MSYDEQIAELRETVSRLEFQINDIYTKRKTGRKYGEQKEAVLKHLKSHKSVKPSNLYPAMTKSQSYHCLFNMWKKGDLERVSAAIKGVREPVYRLKNNSRNRA